MKDVIKFCYGCLPSSLLLSTRLKKFIHHKPIPKSVEIFTIKGTSVQLYRDNSPITTRSYWLGKDGWESKEVAFYEYLCKKVNSFCEVFS